MRPMRTLLPHSLAWMALGAGCEQVEPSKSPFMPVTAEVTASGDAHAPTPGFSNEAPLKRSFDGESMHVESGPADVVAAAKEAEDKATDGGAIKAEGSMASLLSAALEPGDAADRPAEAPQEPSYSTGAAVTGSVVPPSMTTSPPVADPTQVGGGWPVRLVKTVRDAQPPRAILGLPSGKEIVVTPGSMIPEEGLVVVAIGPDKVQLSQVKPQGDHASITSFTLQSMY